MLVLLVGCLNALKNVKYVFTEHIYLFIVILCVGICLNYITVRKSAVRIWTCPRFVLFSMSNFFFFFHIDLFELRTMIKVNTNKTRICVRIRFLYIFKEIFIFRLLYSSLDVVIFII